MSPFQCSNNLRSDTQGGARLCPGLSNCTPLGLVCQRFLTVDQAADHDADRGLPGVAGPVGSAEDRGPGRVEGSGGKQVKLEAGSYELAEVCINCCK
jgi:hypothetical protein